jgi:hypothetical protein
MSWKNKKNTDKDFYPEEIEELRIAYQRMRDIRSDGSGSASGEHYILVDMLRRFGVEDEFESSSQVENYVEHVITYGTKPTLY